MQQNLKVQLNKGTTTVGITCSDGVVLATEKRATMGYMVSHKETQKLFRIDDHIGMTMAGLVGDGQAIARWLTAQADLYKVQRDEPMTLMAASTLMSNVLNNSKWTPFYIQLVLGGVDRDGSHVYSLDAAGGNIPDTYVTTGSGSPFVYGFLEDSFEDGIPTSEGVDLAIRGLTAAMARDSASGNGIQLCTITEDKGYVQFSNDEIDARIRELDLA